MKVAVPVWNGRVSPVFDTARKILVVDIEGQKEVARTEEAIEEMFIPSRAAKLTELGVNVLLCGAISNPLAMMLSASGIEVVPFLTGEIEETLGSYLAGKLPDAKFLMPGCCRRRRRFRGGHGF